MGRLIDGDALTKRLIELCNINCPYTAKARNIMCGSCFMGLALEAVEDAPTIEPERKTGKWIWKLDEGDPSRSMMLVCSICGSGRNEVGTYNFCHICGIKMINPRGEQDETD